MANALNKVNSGGIEDGSIVNADIKSDAAIAGTKLADNAVGLAQMASGTDGQIITYDASGDPIAVGPGTDGQVLTSTGAGSPPAFETLPTSGATLSGSTDNTVVTVTGANAMQGESNFKYDGTDIDLESSSDFNIHMLKTSVADGWIRNIGNLDIAAASGGANGQKVTLSNGANEAGLSAKLTVESGGDITVNTGNLVIGTSGKGIDFSANAHSAGMENELLDDYERGNWTPQFAGGSTNFTQSVSQGYYTKIGNLVYAFWNVAWSSKNSASGAMKITGFPFTSKSNDGQYYYLGQNTGAWTVDSYDDVAWQVMLVGNGTTADYLGYQPGSGNTLQASEMPASSRHYGSIVYPT